MEKEYYQEQIAKIEIPAIHGVTIQLKENTRQTNNLYLNEISAKVLIEWLQKNFT